MSRNSISQILLHVFIMTSKMKNRNNSNKYLKEDNQNSASTKARFTIGSQTQIYSRASLNQDGQFTYRVNLMSQKKKLVQAVPKISPKNGRGLQQLQLDSTIKAKPLFSITSLNPTSLQGKRLQRKAFLLSMWMLIQELNSFLLIQLEVIRQSR